MQHPRASCHRETSPNSSMRWSALLRMLEGEPRGEDSPKPLVRTKSGSTSPQGGSLVVSTLSSESFLSQTSADPAVCQNWEPLNEPTQVSFDRTEGRARSKREGSAGANRRCVLLLHLCNIFCFSFRASHM